jgi:hypothetical protein
LIDARPQANILLAPAKSEPDCPEQRGDTQILHRRRIAAGPYRRLISPVTGNLSIKEWDRTLELATPVVESMTIGE